MTWRRLILAVFGSMLLAACSASSLAVPQFNSSSLPAAPSQFSSGSPVSVAESVPIPEDIQLVSWEAHQRKDGGTLVQLFTDPPTLDPHLTADYISGSVVVEIFGGLVTLNPQLEIIPDLAADWKISPDGKVYTFTINPQAKFHSGKAVTATDVGWSLARATDPKTQSPVAAQYLGDIVGVPERLGGSLQPASGIQVIDESTLQISIDAPKAYFLAKLTYPTGFVLDQDNVESDPANWLRHPNGTGPFILTEYTVGETIILTRNSAYHLGAPHLEQVILVLSGGSAMIMYENDEIHLAPVGLNDLSRVLDPASELHSELRKFPPDFRVSYIGLNLDRPPLDDPKVRRALNLAIDRRTIASTVLQGLVVSSSGIIPPGFPSYNPNLLGYEYNPDLARQLLRESMYGPDIESMPAMTLAIPGGFGAATSLDLEVILQAWAEVGIQTEIQQTSWPTFLEDLNVKRYQMFQSGWVANYPDPESFLDVLFHSASSNNHTNYSNPQVDALLEQARVEPDQATRFQTYNRIERMILNDAPWVLLWSSGSRYTLIKPNVKDYYLTPLLLPKLRYVYFAD